MRIAIIIPTHFKREFITDTILSIQKQTRPPDEVILMNGEWQYGQMNDAVAMSTADAFVYLGDDDTIEPNFLAHLESQMKYKDYDIVTTGIKEFGERNKTHQGRIPFLTFLCKKEVWRQLRGFKEDVGAGSDIDFMDRAIQKGFLILRDDSYLYNYRIHPGQMTYDGKG